MASVKYLLESDQDVLWGLTVNTVGFQSIEPNTVYPTRNHPKQYLFSIEKGRVLSEYQLLYITRGKGTFVSQSCKQTEIKAGNMFFLFPGEWHNFSPDKETGWNHYWIGFKGKNMDNRYENGFFNKQKPIFNIGFDEEITALYNRAIEIAQKQKAGFQQMLAGIVNHLLGFTYSLDKQLFFDDLGITNKIDQAKNIMSENLQLGISPERIAEKVYMSYSWFRKNFKEYTGYTPKQYLLELKIKKSKELLTNTNLLLKEIAFAVGYDNLEHFCTSFKKNTKMTPISYRDSTRKGK
jgi:AraC-like DNA-binding protein